MLKATHEESVGTISLAASSKSRDKLRAFLFQKDAPLSPSDQHKMKEVLNDKENGPMKVDDVQINIMNPPPQPSSQRSAGKDIRDCPQTPVGRLPLSELLANSDDHHYQDLTPIERVLWDNSPLSTATLNSTRKGKKRKRAHSSSPASSSQGRSTKHLAEREHPAGAPSLRDTLKTPKADLVHDLWSRYSLHTTIERSPTAPFNVEFPKFMHSSSPVPELPSRENAGLRRAFSCIDWPTSAAKRRKLRTNSSQTGEIVELAKFGDPLESVENKKSRVSLLIEKINDHLVKSVQRQDSSCSDSGSSLATSNQNSPVKKALADAFSQAQIDGVATTLSQAAMSESRSNLQHSVPILDETAKLHQIETSSDFDDDDLDIGMIEALGGAAEDEKVRDVGELRQDQSSGHVPQILAHNSLGKGPLFEKESKRTEMPNVKSSPEVTVRRPISQNPQQQDDEFDEDDAEMTAVELEGVIAKYDAQIAPAPALDGAKFAKNGDVSRKQPSSHVAYGKVHGKSPVTIEVLSDDEDDFGGDSDFEQIAAEVAASQIEQGGTQTKASVCNTR